MIPDDALPSLLRLAVLNPGGRDREQTFPDAAGQPDDPKVPHPPINYHAYAACTGGSFHVSTAAALATGQPVLLLLRRDLGGGWRALQQLKQAGRTVAVTFKEAGAIQVAARLARPKEVELLTRIVASADGCLAPTTWLGSFYTGLHPANPERTRVIPTPYPLDDPRWDFSIPSAERKGVFVGTREWNTPSRQHLAALLAAREIGERTQEPVSVINVDGRHGAKMLAALGFSTDPQAALRIISGPLPYTVYLREMARHKIVFQLDRSGVPGQVAGDALLCRIPCFGGDGTVEELAFNELCGGIISPPALARLAGEFLDNPAKYHSLVDEAHARALRHLSFNAVAAQLSSFYERLATD